MSELLEFAEFDVEITLTQPMLGTVPKNKEVYSKHILTKSREAIEKAAAKGGKLASGELITDEAIAVQEEEEVETVKDIEEKGWTGFHEDEEGPFLYDYVIKGFLCEAARTIAKQVEKTSGVKQLQDKFKRYVFVKPRRIRLPAINEQPLERPLRAMTAQGPRVTVVRSDVIEAGAVIKFRLRMLDGGSLTKGLLQKVLAYGELIGLGQWRTGSHGQFEVTRFNEV